MAWKGCFKGPRTSEHDKPQSFIHAPHRVIEPGIHVGGGGGVCSRFFLCEKFLLPSASPPRRDSTPSHTHPK